MTQLKTKHFWTIISILTLIVFACSCKKMLEIPPPVTSIVTSQVFATDDQANSAMAGVYYQMQYAYGTVAFCSGGITIYSGMSSDELNIFAPANPWSQFQNNTLQSNNNLISTLWASAYKVIYDANAIIEGLASSKSVHDSARRVLTGEAKFIRAYCYFYLTNLFGDLPFVNTTNWHNTSLLSRSPISQIYNSIVLDLKDAQALLPSDYSISLGERVRPNKWAATALLARVYLYLSDWTNAETQSTSVINNNALYDTASLNSVFLKNSREAIWQLKQYNGATPYNSTIEGNLLIPNNSTSRPNYTISAPLLTAFETGDNRRIAWVGSTKYSGTTYYYPSKYKTGRQQQNPPYTITEYYMMLRLGEQYLIRAEARVNQNNLPNATSDINLIRKRAGLSGLPTTLTQSQILVALKQERRIELFAEWGHRWLDLKRTNQAGVVLAPLKSQWGTNALFYPIPLNEITVDPNLTQNPGY